MDSDVVIVGAGPAGSACASVLTGRGLTVLLVDDGRRHGSWAGESLPPGGIDLMRSVFGDDVVVGHRSAYGVRSSWGSGELGTTDFITTPLGDGLVLDRARFDAQCRDHARSRGATVIPGRFAAMSSSGAEWTSTMQDGGRVRSRWLIDATGRSSSVGVRIGARRERSDRLVAQVLVTEDRGDPVAGTIIEAVPEGWWYSTPLPGNRRVVAMLTDADLLAPTGDRSARWHSALARTSHVSDAVGTITGDGEPAVHRADTSVLHPMSGDRWCAIGDAAASWDPLSSQGLMSAVLMGARAGRALDDETAMQALERDIHLLRSEHAALQSYFYGLERRWADDAFWHRRQR